MCINALVRLGDLLESKTPPCGVFNCSKSLDPGSRLRRVRDDATVDHALRAWTVASLDLAFLVDHVFADDGVVFPDLHLVGGVEVAGAGRGNQADLVAFACHGEFSLHLLAACAQVREHGFDAVLVDGAQRLAGHAQFHPALLAGHPEPAFVQVGQPASLGLVVGVRHVVAALHALSGNLADSCHGILLSDPAWPAGHRPGDGYSRDEPDGPLRSRVALRDAPATWIGGIADRCGRLRGSGWWTGHG